MTRRSMAWLTASVLFIAVNLGGGVVAAAMGEPLHAGAHAGLLLLLAAYFTRRIWRLGKSAIPAAANDLTDGLTRFEQSLDALTFEVERVGEGQRFITQLLTEKGILRALGEGAAQPIQVKARDVAPIARHE